MCPQSIDILQAGDVIEVKFADSLRKKRTRKSKKRTIEELQEKDEAEILTIEEGEQRVVPPREKEKKAKKIKSSEKINEPPQSSRLEERSVPMTKKMKASSPSSHSDQHHRFEEPLESDSDTQQPAPVKGVSTKKASAPAPAPPLTSSKEGLPSQNLIKSPVAPPPTPPPPVPPSPAPRVSQSVPSTRYTQRNEVTRHLLSSFPSLSLSHTHDSYSLRLPMPMPSHHLPQPPP
jgi:hypothetical protein